MIENKQTSDFSEPDLLERFIDGLMTEAEAEEFLANTEDREEALRQREFQSKINASLMRSFKTDSISAEVVTGQILDGFPSNSSEDSYANSLRPKRTSVRDNPLFKLALAASLLLAIGIGAWMYNGASGRVEPVFESVALAELYQNTNGPYYDCEDDERFANTFDSKLGQRLVLSDMPEGTQMLGISYPGGISRNTVAMHGEVDGTPVMVFVDNAGNRGQVIDSVEQDSNLKVFVVEKDGLIFCEVTPLDSAKMIQYFEFLETQ